MKLEFPKNYRFPVRAEQRSLVLCLVYEVNFLLAHIAILAFEVDNSALHNFEANIPNKCKTGAEVLHEQCTEDSSGQFVPLQHAMA